MSESTSFWQLLNRPVGTISDRWIRNIERRAELHKKLWEVIIDTSVVGRHHKEAQQYQIAFSATYYRYGQPPDGTKPADLVNRIVSIVREYGSDFPQFVPILVRFKIFLEGYPWQSDDTLSIADLHQFDEGVRTLVRRASNFLEGDRREASQLRTGLRYFVAFVAFPAVIAYVVFPMLLSLISNLTYQHLRASYFTNFVIGTSLTLAIVIACVISYLFVWRKL